MRLNAMIVNTKVWAMPDNVRPIQLKFGSHRYSMTRDEAIAYAAEIVDAVDTLDAQPTGTAIAAGDEEQRHQDGEPR